MLPEQAFVIWLGGGGCDGCTMAVLGASSPGIEQVLLGAVPGVPPIELIHTALAVEAGAAYMARLEQAAAGQLTPFVLVLEGSVFDETRAGAGFFSGLGDDEDGQPIPISIWIDRLAPRAVAVIAIGTCATWGGIPAAAGNPTGAMGLTDYLGRDFRSLLGLPVINLPGCAPNGDNFIETVAYLFLHIAGIVPLELDDLGRPRWLYSHSFQPYDGGPEVRCNVPVRGWMRRVGGCATVGGRCIACTMPGFPDYFSPLIRLEQGGPA
ncbi:MAG: hydrogenase expression protein HypE [Roseiflexaceae bacterium]